MVVQRAVSLVVMKAENLAALMADSKVVEWVEMMVVLKAGLMVGN